MSYAKKAYSRGTVEKIFLPAFLLITLIGYIALKYPESLI